MDNRAHISYLVQDRSYFSIYKREIHKLAADHNFSAKLVAEIDIIVAEIMSNLMKHANGGELLVKMLDETDGPTLELISIDNGPGMADPLKMITDGVSTTNTLGHGLGAIKRLSDVFQIYSIKEWGTVLLTRIHKEKQDNAQKPSRVTVRTVTVPKPGEKVCGDGYYYKGTTDYWKIFVGDGLGHGEDAHAAVLAAVQSFRTDPSNDPVEVIRTIHDSVKRTRGLVGTVATYDIKEKQWQICGVGNIATNILAGTTTKTYMPYNGVIGMNIPHTMKNQTAPNLHSQLLVMCSDGIRNRWEINKYPQILRYDLSILAAAIYKDCARKTDDMSVIVCKVN
jgi:anti-sigma regulatory factor (Ser/Thr protein kinase)